MVGLRAFLCACLVASALACSDSTSEPDAAAGTAGNGAGAAGSSGVGGSGAGAVGGSAGSGSSGGGGSGTGGAGGSATGGSGGGTGGASGTGMSSGGTGGGTELDCSTWGEGCVELCEGGLCSCDCSGAPCPLELPTVDAQCASSMQICFYEERTSCNSLWQCHNEHWVLLERGACPSSDDALCPVSAEAYVAEGTCPPSGCVYDGVVCSCSPPSCSGIQQDPQPTCVPVVPAVCRDELVDSAACAPFGTRCGTMCCGIGWECTANGWQSTDYPCPP